MITWSISTVKTNVHIQMLSENRFKRLQISQFKSNLFADVLSVIKGFSAVVVCHPSRKRNAWFLAVFHLFNSPKQSKQNTDACRCITLIDFLVFSINATAKFAKKRTKQVGNVSFRYLRNLKMTDVQRLPRVLIR